MIIKQSDEKELITRYVYSGEVVIGKNNMVLISSPLGSCVAVLAYDNKTKIGGMAHVMLPEKSPYNKSQTLQTRYAIDAIDFLIKELTESGAIYNNINICLVGGANVLKKKNDSIANDIINSIVNIIKRKKLPVKAISLGGFERRIASIDLINGIVLCKIGDGAENMLWKF